MKTNKKKSRMRRWYGALPGMVGAGANEAGEIDVAAATTSRLDQRGQLGSLAPRVVFEDREGDIWLGSPTGIECFRRNTLRAVGLPAVEGGFSRRARRRRRRRASMSFCAAKAYRALHPVVEQELRDRTRSLAQCPAPCGRADA